MDTTPEQRRETVVEDLRVFVNTIEASVDQLAETEPSDVRNAALIFVDIAEVADQLAETTTEIARVLILAVLTAASQLNEAE